MEVKQKINYEIFCGKVFGYFENDGKYTGKDYHMNEGKGDNDSYSKTADYFSSSNLVEIKEVLTKAFQLVGMDCNITNDHYFNGLLTDLQSANDLSLIYNTMKEFEKEIFDKHYIASGGNISKI